MQEYGECQAEFYYNKKVINKNINVKEKEIKKEEIVKEIINNGKKDEKNENLEYLEKIRGKYVKHSKLQL